MTGIALAWVLLAWSSVAGQGGDVRPFDDPMLWIPGAALVGLACGPLVLACEALLRRRFREAGAGSTGRA